MKIQKKRPGKAHPLKMSFYYILETSQENAKDLGEVGLTVWRGSNRLEAAKQQVLFPRGLRLYIADRNSPTNAEKNPANFRRERKDAALSLSLSLFLSLSLTLSHTLSLSFSSSNIGSNYHPFSLILSLRLAPKLWPEILFSYVTFYLSFARNPFSKMSYFGHLFLYFWLFYVKCSIGG